MERQDTIGKGQESYQRWLDSLRADPQFQAIYKEEGEKKELWLQLVEARQAAGLTQAEVAGRLGVSQAQVARVERRGYDSYTLSTLRRYIQALGGNFALQVEVRRVDPETTAQPLTVLR
jgi:DNA-binding XRE family transcriptional regulator